MLSACCKQALLPVGWGQQLSIEEFPCDIAPAVLRVDPQGVTKAVCKH